MLDCWSQKRLLLRVRWLTSPVFFVVFVAVARTVAVVLGLWSGYRPCTICFLGSNVTRVMPTATQRGSDGSYSETRVVTIC